MADGCLSLKLPISNLSSFLLFVCFTFIILSFVVAKLKVSLFRIMAIIKILQSSVSTCNKSVLCLWTMESG